MQAKLTGNTVKYYSYPHWILPLTPSQGNASATATVVSDCLRSPKVFVFGELFDIPSIVEVIGSYGKQFNSKKQGLAFSYYGNSMFYVCRMCLLSIQIRLTFVRTNSFFYFFTIVFADERFR